MKIFNRIISEKKPPFIFEEIIEQVKKDKKDKKDKKVKKAKKNKKNKKVLEPEPEPESNIIDNLDICKVDINKNVYKVINFDNEIQLPDIICDDDTNQMVLNKIGDYIKCSPDEIFAWYETDDNMYPLGFNYFNNILFGYC